MCNTSNLGGGDRRIMSSGSAQERLARRNRTKKPLAIALSGAGRGSRAKDSGSDLTNVQQKSIWNCHNKSSLYNELYPNKK
jgi:hypothetical protein